MEPLVPPAVPSSTSPTPSTRWQPLAAVAAWVFPGLGHLLTGQITRGIVLMVAIGSLWTAGLLIGGISVIEHRSESGAFRPWFLGQMLVAPTLPVDYLHLKLREAHVREFGHIPEPDDPRIPYTPAFGRVHEQGTLYTALAGLLNLLAILHITYLQPKRIAGPASPTPPTPAPAANP